MPTFNVPGDSSSAAEAAKLVKPNAIDVKPTTNAFFDVFMIMLLGDTCFFCVLY